MASTPSPERELQQFDDDDDEEEEDEDDDDDEEEDEDEDDDDEEEDEDDDYDPEADEVDTPAADPYLEEDFRVRFSSANPEYSLFLESFFASRASVPAEPLEVVVLEEEEEEEEGEEDEAGGVCYKEEEDTASGPQSSATPNCPICFEPWASDGPHRVCCIPCGHLYGRSCLEEWLQRCRQNSGKCPQCKGKCKQKDIINLYAPPLVVPNDDLEKELRSLRENNELLQLKNAQLQEEIKKHKTHSRENESSGRQKILCLGPVSLEEPQRRLFAGFNERWRTSLQTLSDGSYGSQNFRGDGSRQCSFVLQKEFAVDGARVMGIDVSSSSSILVISGKAPGVGLEHVLSKVNLLVPSEIDRIQLPSNIGAIRDMCIISNQLALVASLGKKLSLFSMSSNNCVLGYDLPGPAWSCSGDFNSPYHIYAGLQNGMLLVFDMRQTARHLDSVEGLSRHPVHTIQSILDVGGTRKVLTASSLGPCVWDVGGSGERPFLIPEMENQGVCISLASGSSSDYIVASFRPKVEFSNDGMPSSASLSPSPTVSGSGRLGSHVLMKRVNDASYQRHAVAYGTVSEARMSKSAIIPIDDSLLFAYGDESSHGVCLWDLPSLQVYNYLKPHPHPILDLKYARTSGPGFLGCISEDRCQVFTCF